MDNRKGTDNYSSGILRRIYYETDSGYNEEVENGLWETIHSGLSKT